MDMPTVCPDKSFWDEDLDFWDLLAPPYVVMCVTKKVSSSILTGDRQMY